MINFKKILSGYQTFRKKYASGDASIMEHLSHHGQQPKTMIVACCDSRVDPALILQCDPGDLFVVRNVANIVPPYEVDDAHHGTSAALEFGIRFLNIKHLVILGHSQCGGIQTLIENKENHNDFITNWVSLIKLQDCKTDHADDYAKLTLHESKKNCLTFPWIREKLEMDLLHIHLWFFDIKAGQVLTYCQERGDFFPLDE